MGLFCPRHKKEWFPKVMNVEVQVMIRCFLIVGSDRRNLDFTQLAFGPDNFVKMRLASESLSRRFLWHLISYMDFNERLRRDDPVSSHADSSTMVGFVFCECTCSLNADIFTNLKIISHNTQLLLIYKPSSHKP